jgi:hypothetical protein
MSLDDMMLREEIARAIEAIPLGENDNQLNALGMRMIAAKVARGDSNMFANVSLFENQIDFE